MDSRTLNKLGSTGPYLKTELRGPTRTSSDHAREAQNRTDTFKTNLYITILYIVHCVGYSDAVRILLRGFSSMFQKYRRHSNSLN